MKCFYFDMLTKEQKHVLYKCRWRNYW